MFPYYLLNSSSFEPKLDPKNICFPIETDQQLLKHSSSISLYLRCSFHFPGLENVSKYPDLFAALADDGWTDEEMDKLAGRNILRVFKVRTVNLNT